MSPGKNAVSNRERGLSEQDLNRIKWLRLVRKLIADKIRAIQKALQHKALLDANSKSATQGADGDVDPDAPYLQNQNTGTGPAGGSS